MRRRFLSLIAVGLMLVSVGSSKMNAVANRLKGGLELPKAKDKTEFTRAQSVESLLLQIEEMNAIVKAFVTNPIFGQMKADTADLAIQASVGLSTIISLSKVLKDGASQLPSQPERN